MKYGYHIECVGEKNLGSADTFKTEKKALEVAKKDFKQFRSNVTEAVLTIENEDGKVTMKLKRCNNEWRLIYSPHWSLPS